MKKSKESRINVVSFWGFMVLAFLLAGCDATEKITYFQNVSPNKQQTIRQLPDITIGKDDLLAIIINSKDPELALPFNMPLTTFQIGSQTVPQHRLLGYLVNSDGDIDFPILGQIHVMGLTRKELTSLIKEKLIAERLINDPVVTVQFLNFKVSVIGEVSRPGMFTISSDRITLLEALAMAGDLTIYGKRDRVAVTREENGKRTTVYHDLRSANLFNSPYYYLQQNDVVYVEPNRARSGQSQINQNNSANVWLSAVSVMSSLAVLIINLTK